MFGIKPIESKRVNDFKAVVIKNLTYDEARNLETCLIQQGINSIEEIKSNKRDNIIQMVKAICRDTETAANLIKEGVKIGYMKHKVETYIFTPKLLVCYACGGFNHTKNSNKCKLEKKCIKCSNRDHESFDCPQKGKREGLCCPNCNESHPATYAGCSVFKIALTNIHKKSSNELKSYKASNNKNSRQLLTPKLYSDIASTSSESRIIDIIEKSATEIKDEIKQLNSKFITIEKELKDQITNYTNNAIEVNKTLNAHESVMDDDLNKLAIGINESFHLIMNCINKTQGFGIKETKEKYTTSINQLFKSEILKMNQ